MNNETCPGVCNGAIQILPEGGTPPYSYDWAHLPGTNGLSETYNLCVGTYCVTVVDANGCSGSYCADITEAECMLLDTQIAPSSCAYNSGVIDLTVSGGNSANYTYLWSLGATTQDVSSIGPGTYCVTVTDASGCTTSECYVVPSTTPPSVILSVNHASGGLSNGSITATATGGLPPYFLTWSNGSNVFSIDNLSPGTYCVTVTDSYGCTTVACGTVQSFGTSGCLLNIGYTGTVPNAVLYANSQAPGNNAYIWSGPGGFSSNLASPYANVPGTYCVTVTVPQYGCTSTACVAVPGATPLTVEGQVTHSGCGYPCTGSVTATGAGGAPPYTYGWSNSSTTSTITNMCGGTVTVTVTDAAGQTATRSFTIFGGGGTIEPIPITSSNPAYCNAVGTAVNGDVCEKVCPGARVNYSVGEILACVTPPSSFTWTIVGAESYQISADTKDATVVWGAPGPGLIEVLSGSGQICFETERCVEITEEPLAQFLTNPPPENGVLTVCRGQNVFFDNTSLNSALYEWQFADNLSNSAAENAEHVFNLPGTHRVTLIARTECLCADTTFLDVEVLDAFSPLLDCISTLCPGEQVTYTADAQCGQYDWTISPNGIVTGGGGASDNSVTVLWSGGSQGVITLEASACTGATCPARAVVQVPILSDEAEIEGEDRACPGSEETYKIEPYKGANYAWSIKPNTGQIVEGQGRNAITILWNEGNIDTWVAVEYDNCYLGCTGRDTLQVRIRPPFGIVGAPEACADATVLFKAQTIPTNVSVNCSWQAFGPSGTSVPGALPNGTQINLSLSQGYGTYRLYAWPTGAGLANTCSDSAAWEIGAAARPPQPTGISGSNYFCAGQSLSYTATGTVPLYNTKWELKQSNLGVTLAEGNPVNATFQAGTPRYVAAWQVTADALACRSDTVMKTVLPIPALTITGPNSACPGEEKTYSVAQFEGLTYQWSIQPAGAAVIKSGQGTNQITVFWDESAVFTLSVSACGQSDNHSVTVWPEPVPDPVYPYGVCAGATATVEANGAYPNYQWKNESGTTVGGAYTAQLGAGNYALVVTDNHGCKGTTEFSIERLPTPNVTLSTVDRRYYCFNSPSVWFTALVDADGDFDFQWLRNNAPTGGNQPTYHAVDSGYYRVVVTNQYGCTGSDGPIEVYKSCITLPPNDTCQNCGAGDCPLGTVNFETVPLAACESFEFIANPNGLPYVAGATSWSFRREGVGVLGYAQGEIVEFTFPNAGLYIAQVNILLPDNSVCRAADTVSVLAHAQFAHAAGCPGFATTFTDETTFLPGYENGASWRWDFNDAASANTDTSSTRNPSWNYAGSLVYSPVLTITAPGGCTTTATATVNIPDLPVFNFLPQTLTCAGNAIPLGVIAPNNVTQVAWNFGDPASGSLNEIDGKQVFHAYTNAGNYTATATATNVAGCTASQTMPVSVTPNTLAGSITPVNTTICEGKSVTLQAPNGGAGANYQWSDQSMGQNLVVAQEGIYRVTITTPQGCTYAPPPKAVEVNPAPDGEIMAQLTNDLGQITGYAEDYHEVCFGQDVLLEVIDNGTYQYAWSGSLGGGSTQEFSDERGNLLSVGTYNYAVTITNGLTGCTSVAPVFTVDVRPTPSGFSAMADQNCAGTPSTVSYVGANQPTWQLFWNNGETGTSFVTLDPGHFFVRAVNEYGCSANSAPVTVHPGPNIGAIPGGCHTRCEPDSLCIAVMPEITSWQWYYEGTAIPGATSPDFVALESGAYWVAVSDTNGCSAVSEPLVLTLYTGYGDVYGQVWSDVNDNGVIDAADTLVSGIAVNLWQTDSLTASAFSQTNGAFVFADYLAVDYAAAIDTAALSPIWEIVVGSDEVELTGCNSQTEADLLIRHIDCVTSSQNVAAQACAGETYIFRGVAIPAGQTQTLTFTDLVTGCDSVFVVQVAALPIAQSGRTERVCAGEFYTFQGQNIAVGQSQTFALTHPTTGCDSLLTISVEALPTAQSGRTERVCAGEFYTFQGQNIAVGQSQTFALPHPTTGCDSLLTISVEALPTAQSGRTERVCAGEFYTFQGQNIAVGQSQTFALTHPTTGCDSLLTIGVEALPTAQSGRTERVCAGEFYTFQGQNIAVGQSQTFALPHPTTGCDSLLTISVEALPTAQSGRTERVCAGEFYTFQGQNIAVGQSQTFALPHPTTGCDSLLTISVEAYPTAQSGRTERVCAGEFYTFQGQNIAVGQSQTFALTHPTTGCDSLLTISVEAYSTAQSSRTQKICPDETYTFEGQTLQIGQVQTFTLTNPATGCDSLVTIFVESLPIKESGYYAAACSGQNYSYYGFDVAAGTTQVFTLTNPTTGCDSLVTVHVIAIPLPQTHLDVRVCPGELFDYNGQMLEPGDTYEFHYLTVQGECDSTVWVNVTEWPSTSYDLAAENTCPNATEGVIEIADLNGVSAPYDYSIDNGQNWQMELIFSDLDAGEYTVLVRDAEGCIFTQTVEISAWPALHADLASQIILPCDSAMVTLAPEVSGYAANLTYAWTDGSNLPTLTIDQAGAYSVTVSNACETLTRSTEAQWADLPEGFEFVYVPNVVGPEASEQINAIFRPQFVAGIVPTRYRLEVYDRWGDQIFRSQEAETGWDVRDAIRKNRLAGAAVFVWWLEADIEWCGRTVTLRKKGDVTVVR